MIHFDAPDGFTLPEGVKPGSKFEAVAELKMGGDGRITLVTLDGMEVGSEEEEEGEAENEAPEGGGFLDKMEQTFEEHGMGRKKGMM